MIPDAPAGLVLEDVQIGLHDRVLIDIAAVVRKWYGVVPEASKNRPSIEPMQPSVQNGSSISAIVVP